MRRRTFIQFIGAVVTICPAVAHAQSPASSPKRIGFLEIASEELNHANMQAFQDGMTRLGYSRGKDYEIHYQSEEGMAQRLPALVQGLIERHVDVIVTRGTPAALAAKAATSTIAIVMVASGGPLDRPADQVRVGGQPQERQRDRDRNPPTLLARADEVLE